MQPAQRSRLVSTPLATTTAAQHTGIIVFSAHPMGQQTDGDSSRTLGIITDCEFDQIIRYQPLAIDRRAMDIEIGRPQTADKAITFAPVIPFY